MAEQNKLFDRFKRISPAQFEEVLFLLKIDPSIIPSPFAGQSIRAIRVIQWLEQKQDGLERWERTLAEPAISSIREVQELFALPCCQWHWERYQRMIFRN